MKAMLRTVLFLDAALNLALGVLLIVSFWSSLYAAIEVPAPSPVLYAQALGVAFVGVAWLQWHATVNGQLTATVAKVTGHINWVIGAFVLGWLISGQLAVTGGRVHARREPGHPAPRTVAGLVTPRVRSRASGQPTPWRGRTRRLAAVRCDR